MAKYNSTTLYNKTAQYPASTVETGVVPGVYVDPATGTAVTKCVPCAYNPAQFPARSNLYTRMAIVAPGCALNKNFTINVAQQGTCGDAAVPFKMQTVV